jgi:CDP-6-deoxy-D-xylo-4-hexulose-3-dehydrase
VRRITTGGANADHFSVAEKALLLECIESGQLTAGKFTARFERELAEIQGVPSALFVNSGSSANLLAVAALMSPLLDNPLVPGDEVITVAAAFPTTIAPIVQLGLVPVFVDVRAPDYNVDPTLLEAAVSPRTRAVMLAHTLGMPFDVHAVTEFCRKHDLFLVEDTCDALGTVVGAGTGSPKLVGTFGHLATLSFYPAHHMTTAEGGAVLCGGQFAGIVRSLRDWGRDCYCPPGKDNCCGARFNQQFGVLPVGYDHKYVYSQFGFNLKATDMQAAIGCAQLKRLPGFIKARRENWRYLYENIPQIDLRVGAAMVAANPSPFGFMVTVKDDYKLTRCEITAKLEAAGIATRPLFSGNIARQPCMMGDVPHRFASPMVETDRAMFRAFWVGCHPHLSREDLDYMVESFKKVLR